MKKILLAMAVMAVGVGMYFLIDARREVGRLQDQLSQHWTAWSLVSANGDGEIMAVGLAHDQMGPIPKGSLVVKTRDGLLYAVQPDGEITVHSAVDYRRLRRAEREL